MSLVPSSFDFCDFSSLYRSHVPLPLTSIFSNSGKLTSYFDSQNSRICSLVPGSCAPNWLQGKPSTVKPLSSFSSCRSCNPAYCGVSPQRLATLATRQVLPLKVDSFTGSPVVAFIVRS